MHTLVQPVSFPTISTRAIGSIALGIVVTFGLFIVMAKLIEQDRVEIPTQTTVTLGPIIMEPDEPETHEINRIKPMPKPVEMPKTALPKAEETPNETSSQFTMNPINTVGEIKLSTNLGNGLTEGSATPIFRIDPTYPTDAARNGVEGWVQLTFTITPTGTVDDIAILDAKPKRVFDRAARRALSKWKYKPQVVNGSAVSQPNMKVLLEFKLDQ